MLNWSGLKKLLFIHATKHTKKDDDKPSDDGERNNNESVYREHEKRSDELQ